MASSRSVFWAAQSISHTNGSNAPGGGTRFNSVSFRAKLRLKSKNDAFRHRDNFDPDRARRRNDCQSDPAPHKPRKARCGTQTLADRPNATSQQRSAPDPTVRLQIEFYGPEDGSSIVLTHGWGLDGREWNYLKRDFLDRFSTDCMGRTGLGKVHPSNLTRLQPREPCAHLEAVLALAGDKPAILLGHSIGGMITLTFCRLFPSALGSRVSGLVLSHTTPTNPVRTTSGSAFYTAIEKPVLMPLMYLTIALSPLVWLMNWLSYLNGSAHLTNKLSSFGGTETWEQIDFATKFQPQASPAVLARGMLGMMRYDATKTLAAISVPTLVVAGDRDSTTKPEASERIRASVPGARLITLTPAKHLGLIEHHDGMHRSFASLRMPHKLKPRKSALPGKRRTPRKYQLGSNRLLRGL